jgi:alpha-1,3-rhamnosyl/mannosyltransferase
MPVLEAMGRGVPTLTSNTSSLPEVAGDAAVLVDPSDESAIATGLESLLTDEALADRLREAGPLRAQGYTWVATARATLDVYRQLLENA